MEHLIRTTPRSTSGLEGGAAAPDAAPLVAVVTPVYNGAPYLAATMACVQAQTYPNVVHVVLDNASRDATPDIIAAARVDAGPVPILAHKNDTTLPQVANWNAAMALVPPEARYVKLLCADDLMRADAIARMVEIAERNPSVDFVSAVEVSGDQVMPHGFGDKSVIVPGREAMARLLAGSAIVVNAHVFFRATPARLADPFDAATLPAPDADFIMRILSDGDLAFVAEPLLYTRLHEATETTRMGGNRFLIMPSFARLLRYGANVMPGAEFAHARDQFLRQIYRNVVRGRALGQTAIADKLEAALADLGLKPRAIDYARALAWWPFDAVVGRLRLRRDSGQALPARIPEAEFLRPGASPGVR